MDPFTDKFTAQDKPIHHEPPFVLEQGVKHDAEGVAPERKRIIHGLLESNASILYSIPS